MGEERSVRRGPADHGCEAIAAQSGNSCLRSWSHTKEAKWARRNGIIQNTPQSRSSETCNTSSNTRILLSCCGTSEREYGDEATVGAVRLGIWSLAKKLKNPAAHQSRIKVCRCQALAQGCQSLIVLHRSSRHRLLQCCRLSALGSSPRRVDVSREQVRTRLHSPADHPAGAKWKSRRAVNG